MDRDLIGLTLGSYRLTRFLARGGMGLVYEAEHALLGTRAAVKILDPEHSARPDAVTRFFTEARAATSAQHPGITRVFDFGYHDEGAYLVMELLEGETLQDRLSAQGKLPVNEALVIARQMAAAMGAAHAAGIVHRDLKPENIYLARDDDSPDGFRVKILDFGVAKLLHATPSSVHHTQTGQILGTPLYMSPEQCNGAAQIDGRADVYALGCILYDMLTGHPPFDLYGIGEIISAHMYDAPAAPSERVPELPVEVEELVLSLLAKSPDDRPSGMREVEVLLESARFAPPRLTGPIPIALGPLETAKVRRPRPWLRSLGWAGAAAGGIAVIVAMAGASSIEASVPVPAPIIDSTPPVLSALPEPPLPAPAPHGVKVRLESRPSGAEVRRELDGVSLGKTPLELELDAGQTPFSVTMRKRGYVTETIALSAVSDYHVHVGLSRVRRPEPPRAAVLSLPRGTVKDGALDPFVQ